MTPLEIGEMRPEEAAAVQALWARAGLTRPCNDPAKDMDFALQSPCATILVGRVSGVVVATAMVGHDGHRGTVYYLATDPGARDNGYGRAIMAAAENWLSRHGVPKLNLLIRSENHAVQKFYEALGYVAQERISMQKELAAER